MTVFELAGRRVYVAGHNGMVGRALLRRLAAEPVSLITADRGELDLTRQDAVDGWMRRLRPDVVVVAAARVGGILANRDHPADFLIDNLLIAANLIRAAHANAVARLLFLGSSCIYPRLAAQPISEAQLLSGPLEPTNRAYAVAKIAGVELCAAYRRQHGCDFISAMPANLYGPHDRFDLVNGHVAAALLRRFHEAKLARAPEVVLWGTGTPRRELLHVDDLADACVFLLRNYADEASINVGTGSDLAIAELAAMIAEIVEYRGRLRFDTAQPDGTPRKLLDVGRLTALGWTARISLRDGLAATYRWYREHH